MMAVIRRGLPRAASGVAYLLTLSLVSPVLIGCSGRGGGGSQANLPPIDDTRGGTTRVQPTSEQRGMSTGKKVAILAGAAALYYLYKRSQDKKKAAAGERQYHLSKNGRVYYRDENGRAHWVTEPPAPIEVPVEELQRYPEVNRYRGYNNQNSGLDFGNLFSGR
jgi:hypothetical protein